MRLFSVLITGALALLGSATANPLHAASVPTAAVADVSETAIAASNRKVAMAYQALVSMWSGRFADIGQRFAAPALLAYRGPVRTSCGVMSANNAAYCTARNAISAVMLQASAQSTEPRTKSPIPRSIRALRPNTSVSFP